MGSSLTNDSKRDGATICCTGAGWGGFGVTVGGGGDSCIFCEGTAAIEGGEEGGEGVFGGGGGGDGREGGCE